MLGIAVCARADEMKNSVYFILCCVVLDLSSDSLFDCSLGDLAVPPLDLVDNHEDSQDNKQ